MNKCTPMHLLERDPAQPRIQILCTDSSRKAPEGPASLLGAVALGPAGVQALGAGSSEELGTELWLNTWRTPKRDCQRRVRRFAVFVSQASVLNFSVKLKCSISKSCTVLGVENLCGGCQSTLQPVPACLTHVQPGNPSCSSNVTDHLSILQPSISVHSE